MKYPSIDPQLVEYLEEIFPVDINMIETTAELEYNKGIQRVISHLRQLSEDPELEGTEVESVVNIADDEFED